MMPKAEQQDAFRGAVLETVESSPRAAQIFRELARRAIELQGASRSRLARDPEITMLVEEFVGEIRRRRLDAH
jgi:hypothetical protein